MTEITAGKAIEWETDCDTPTLDTDSLLEALATVGKSTLPVPMIDKVNYFPLSTAEEALARHREAAEESRRAQLPK